MLKFGSKLAHGIRNFSISNANNLKISLTTFLEEFT